MPLRRFQRVDPPIPPAEVKTITGSNYSFRGTMFSIDDESGAKLQNHIRKRTT